MVQLAVALVVDGSAVVGLTLALVVLVALLLLSLVFACCCITLSARKSTGKDYSLIFNIERLL